MTKQEVLAKIDWKLLREQWGTLGQVHDVLETEEEYEQAEALKGVWELLAKLIVADDREHSDEPIHSTSCPQCHVGGMVVERTCPITVQYDGNGDVMDYEIIGNLGIYTDQHLAKCHNCAYEGKPSTFTHGETKE